MAMAHQQDTRAAEGVRKIGLQDHCCKDTMSWTGMWKQCKRVFSGNSSAHRTLLEWRAIARRKSCAPLLHRCRTSRSVCRMADSRLSAHHQRWPCHLFKAMRLGLKPLLICGIQETQNLRGKSH